MVVSKKEATSRSLARESLSSLDLNLEATVATVLQCIPKFLCLSHHLVHWASILGLTISRNFLYNALFLAIVYNYVDYREILFLQRRAHGQIYRKAFRRRNLTWWATDQRILRYTFAESDWCHSSLYRRRCTLMSSAIRRRRSMPDMNH